MAGRLIRNADRLSSFTRRTRPPGHGHPIGVCPVRPGYGQPDMSRQCPGMSGCPGNVIAYLCVDCGILVLTSDWLKLPTSIPLPAHVYRKTLYDMI